VNGAVTLNSNLTVGGIEKQRGYNKRLVIPFVNGTAWDDRGWDVDQAAEYAATFFSLPPNISSVVAVYIYAHSVVTEGDKMELDIAINGGADNEPYNTHSYSGSGVDSTSSNFAANDIIYWTVTHADVTALTGGDSVEVKVVYAAAAGANCATDARFRTIEIEYT